MRPSLAAQRWRPLFWAMLAVSLVAFAQSPGDRPRPLQSGLDFAGPELRAMQQDDLANPGMLWVARGDRLWREHPSAAGKSCADCHREPARSMGGVAARYPMIDAASGHLLNLESRINQCRGRHQGAPALALESEDLLALAALVAFQSRGLPLEVRIDGPAHPHFEAGRALYYQRVGQLNLSCAHCHQSHWGRRLLGETISQGHGNAYPAYRLSWQAVGSLQRRLRGCFSSVRAEMPALGSPELTDLELFLAWRANGLPMESPGVRR